VIDAKSYLLQVERLDARIENKLIERQQWRDIALGITASIGAEKVQSSGSQQKMANAIEKCVDMETEIDKLIDEFINTKKKVIETIEKLYSPTEYRILHLRYIQHISLTEIADILNKEYTWVTTTHGRALKNVQNILNRQ
jgi:DNA-directed RNA polymerase specialized sigma subunit